MRGCWLRQQGNKICSTLVMSSGHRTSASTSYRDALIVGNQGGDQADAGLMTEKMLAEYTAVAREK